MKISRKIKRWKGNGKRNKKRLLKLNQMRLKKKQEQEEQERKENLAQELIDRYNLDVEREKLMQVRFAL